MEIISNPQLAGFITIGVIIVVVVGYIIYKVRTDKK